MRERLKVWIPIAAVVAVLAVGFVIATWPTGDEATPAAPDTPSAASSSSRTATTRATLAATRTAAPATRTTTGTALDARRDLARDESAGGHTLERHVGKTDQQLRDRLKREPDISAASTYTNRDIAERVVGTAIQRNQAKITEWVRKGAGRANLAFEFEAGEVIGRSIDQGKTTARNVTSATIVLRANGSDWYVLTSYPDD